MAEVLYLALALKSNLAQTWHSAAVEDVRYARPAGVLGDPRNAPLGLMRGLGYGKGCTATRTTTAAWWSSSICRDALAASVLHARRQPARAADGGGPTRDGSNALRMQAGV